MKTHLTTNSPNVRGVAGLLLLYQIERISGIDPGEALAEVVVVGSRNEVDPGPAEQLVQADACSSRTLFMRLLSCTCIFVS